MGSRQFLTWLAISKPSAVPPPPGVPLDPGIPTKTHGLTNFALDPFGESCDLGAYCWWGPGGLLCGIFCGGAFLGSRLSIMDG